MSKFLHYLFFAFLLRFVRSQEFLNIFKDRYVNIKAIAVNDQLLAIFTDDFLIFGNISYSLYFIELDRIRLSRIFNSILEFKFVDKKAVVICNENECNYCDFSDQYSGSCVVIASFPMQSVNVQKVNKLFFLRVVHNTTTAGIYSFKLENLIFNSLGEAFDHSSSIHKFKAIYGFSHKDHTYFISQVQRSDIVTEILSNLKKSNFTLVNNDIVITQICNNDESKDIISRMDLVLACKDIEMDPNYISKYNDKFVEKVTAAAAASEMLLLGVEKLTSYSFICKFAMKDIELKFQHTWTNCQSMSHPFKKCRIVYVKECLILGWKNDILDKSKLPMCRKFGLQKETIESSCEAALSLTTVHRYGWLENIEPHYGEYLKLDINNYSSVHGIYPQSNNKDIFILQTDIIIKAIFENTLLQSIKSLTKYELYVENNKMVTPIEFNDGVLYVDPIENNSIYFKSIKCYEKDCHEVLFNEKLYCSFSFCLSNARNNCHSLEETICAPFWVNARNLISMNDKQNQQIFGIGYNETDEYYRLQITCQENGKKTNNKEACSDINVFMRQVIRKSEKSTNINEIAKSLDETMNHDDNTLLPYILWTFGFVAGFFLLLTTIFLVYRRFQLHKNNNMSLQSMPKNRTIQQKISKNGKYERVLSEENLINSKNITKLGKLGKPGQGNSAFVCPAIYSIGSCVQKVAIKKLKEYNETEIMEETLRLSSCKHSNIVKFIGWLKIKEEICMITEFMDGGDLHTYLKDPSKPLTSSIIFSYIFQILDAMIYLSQCKILHRDLAARNCLLDKFYKIIKIADFGTSRDMDENYEYISERGCKLPFRCLPPEALFQKEFIVKGDVWSFAILIWEMFEKGAVPYEGLTADGVKNFLRAKQRLSRPPHCPFKLYNVMKACWKKDPEQRPNFESLKRDIKIIFNKIPEEKLELSIREPLENEVKNEDEE